MSAPKVSFEPAFNLDRGESTGPTSCGLGPSQGCIVVLALVLFRTESRNATSPGFSQFPDAAAVVLWLADAFLPSPITKPELSLRRAEPASTATEIDGEHVGVESLSRPLAEARSVVAPGSRETLKAAVKADAEVDSDAVKRPSTTPTTSTILWVGDRDPVPSDVKLALELVSKVFLGGNALFPRMDLLE